MVPAPINLFSPTVLHAPYFREVSNAGDADLLNEWNLDQENQQHQCKKVHFIQRQDMLYSKMSLGLITWPWSLQRNDSTLALKSVLKQFFEIDVTKMKLNGNLAFEKCFRQIHLNYRKCRLGCLLNTFCPLPKTKCSKVHLADAIAMNTPHKQLFSFMHALYRTIFPIKIFGSRHNQKIFFRNIKIIITASLVTKFRVWDIASDIDFEAMSPLFTDFPLSEHSPKGTMEILCLLWIFSCFKNILKSLFYITERGNQKYTLVFYRFDLWARIRHIGLEQLKQKENWQLQSPAGPLSSQKMYDYVKYSALRLIPKAKSIRPITSLKDYHKKAVYKRKLHDYLLVLRKVGQLAALDRSDGSAHKIHERIGKLKGTHKGPFYIVRGDFEDCYPSIDLTKLLNLVEKRLPLLTRQALLNGQKLPAKGLPIERINVIRRKLHFKARRADFVVKPVHCGAKSIFKHSPNISRLLLILKKSLGLSNCTDVSISSMGNDHIDLNEFSDMLDVYLCKAQVPLGKKTAYRPQQGIRQGGALSTTLCDLYLNELWKEVLQTLDINFNSDTNFFFNLADDFIFVNTDLKKAQEFARWIQRGFPDWGLYVNVNKFRTNFDIETGALNNEMPINFFGRKIFPEDLSFGIDFDSFASIRMADTFNCNPFLPVCQVMKMCSSK